jgi:ActR/RegA family two-component response regulator
MGSILVVDDDATLHEMELRYMRQVRAAARILGIDRRSLYRKLEAPPPEPTS